MSDRVICRGDVRPGERLVTIVYDTRDTCAPDLDTLKVWLDCWAAFHQQMSPSATRCCRTSVRPVKASSVRG